MRKRRVDPPDTVDEVLRILAGLQAEGWHMERCGLQWEYSDADKHGAVLPIGVKLSIRLKV